jgi:ABC-type Mn2+/Zn2+ transport system ATPase subunit
VQNCTWGYGGRPIVRVDALDVARGSCVGVFGPNGAGKSTLVAGLVGLLPPMSGHVQRDASLRIGFLPQGRTLQLHWPMSALDAAGLVTSTRHRFGWLGSRRKGVIDSMARLQVADLADQPFARLSGGQQQRVMLAGALADRPDVLVLDEPTDGLDTRSREVLLQTLVDQRTSGVSIVLISHEIRDLLAVANQVAVVRPAEQEGSPSHVELINTSDLAARAAKGDL